MFARPLAGLLAQLPWAQLLEPLIRGCLNLGGVDYVFRTLGRQQYMQMQKAGSRNTLGCFSSPKHQKMFLNIVNVSIFKCFFSEHDFVQRKSLTIFEDIDYHYYFLRVSLIQNSLAPAHIYLKVQAMKIPIINAKGKLQFLIPP